MADLVDGAHNWLSDIQALIYWLLVEYFSTAGFPLPLRGRQRARNEDPSPGEPVNVRPSLTFSFVAEMETCHHPQILLNWNSLLPLYSQIPEPLRYKWPCHLVEFAASLFQIPNPSHSFDIQST